MPHFRCDRFSRACAQATGSSDRALIREDHQRLLRAGLAPPRSLGGVRGDDPWRFPRLTRCARLTHRSRSATEIFHHLSGEAISGFAHDPDCAERLNTRRSPHLGRPAGWRVARTTSPSVCRHFCLMLTATGLTSSSPRVCAMGRQRPRHRVPAFRRRGSALHRGHNSGGISWPPASQGSLGGGAWPWLVFVTFSWWASAQPGDA